MRRVKLKRVVIRTLGAGSGESVEFGMSDNETIIYVEWERECAVVTFLKDLS